MWRMFSHDRCLQMSNGEIGVEKLSCFVGKSVLSQFTLFCLDCIYAIPILPKQCSSLSAAGAKAKVCLMFGALLSLVLESFQSF